jgi:hypothetical protein
MIMTNQGSDHSPVRTGEGPPPDDALRGHQFEDLGLEAADRTSPSAMREIPDAQGG